MSDKLRDILELLFDFLILIIVFGLLGLALFLVIEIYIHFIGVKDLKL